MPGANKDRGGTQARQAFRDKLPARARAAFDRLARLTARPRADPRWRHQAGTRARELMRAARFGAAVEWSQGPGPGRHRVRERSVA
jgi:hypothetical protein